MISVKGIFYHKSLTVLFRLVTGGIFVFSGFTKLMLPPEEFAEVIRNYQIVPQPFLFPLTVVIPWVEFLSGAFLLIGLFTRVAAGLVAAQLAGFMVVLSIVLATGVNLEDCGCFVAIGLKETPLQALIRDGVLFAMTVIFALSGSRAFSLDSRLEQAKEI